MKKAEKQVEPVDFDFVFAGASVLRVEGALLTATGIYKTKIETKYVPCVKIRVNREERQQVVKGDELKLDSRTKVRIVKIELPESKSAKGKIYLKKVS